MSLGPLGTLPYAVTIRKRCGFFPNYLWRLDHATLMDTFPELVGDIFCSGRGSTRAWQIPKPCRGTGQWEQQRGLSHLPDSSQQGREQGLPTGFAGASGGEQRADSFCQAWLDIPFLPSLSLLWQCLSGVSCSCSSRRQEVGKEGKKEVDFVQHSDSNQPSLKHEKLAFPFPVPLPCSQLGAISPQCNLLQVHLPGLKKQTSNHKLILSGASAIEFINLA